MNKTLIHQTYYEYPLHLHFNSPIGDISSYWEEVTKEIYDTWVTGYKDWEWLSRTAIIMRKIANTIRAEMPFMWPEYDYYDVILSILCWEMYHEYYTSWPDWEKFFDLVDWEGSKSKKRPSYKVLSQANDAWEKAITEFLVPIKWVHLDWWDEKEKRPDEYWNVPKRNFKVSQRWIKYAKEKWYDERIVKWLNELYVRRWYKSDFRILEAIISYVYFDKELFLYFHPHQFELCICDKESLEFQHSWAYMILDFWNVINNVFCEDCIEKLRKNNPLKDIKKEDSQEILIRALKKACKDLIEIAIQDHYDDFDVTLNWYVNDINRFHELDENTAFWTVGFVKHERKKKKVLVKSTETLKDAKKSLKKK